MGLPPPANSFSTLWVSEQMRDGRRSYQQVLKVLTCYAASHPPTQIPVPLTTYRFSTSRVSEQMRDGRRGYHETLKVLTGYAAAPVVVLIGVTAFGLRDALAALLSAA